MRHFRLDSPRHRHPNQVQRVQGSQQAGWWMQEEHQATLGPYGIERS